MKVEVVPHDVSISSAVGTVVWYDRGDQDGEVMVIDFHGDEHVEFRKHSNGYWTKFGGHGSQFTLRAASVAI